MSTLEVEGSPVQQADNEIVKWTISFEDQLDSGVTVSSAAATVYDETDHENDVSIGTKDGSEVVASPNVSQEIKALERGHWYRLEILATLSDGQKRMAYLRIECVT